MWAPATHPPFTPLTAHTTTTTAQVPWSARTCVLVWLLGCQVTPHRQPHQGASYFSVAFTLPWASRTMQQAFATKTSMIADNCIPCVPANFVAPPPPALAPRTHMQNRQKTHQGCDGSCSIPRAAFDAADEGPLEHCRLAGLPDLNQSHPFVRHEVGRPRVRP
jgi:hypothetical protein